MNCTHKQIEKALSERLERMEREAEKRELQIQDALRENMNLSLELELARRDADYYREDQRRQADRGDSAYEQLRGVVLEIDQWKWKASEAERKAERIYEECVGQVRPEEQEEEPRELAASPKTPPAQQQ